ncbi:MAG: DUF760 domain-containing protein [Synechococcaceae cyanobacterium RL_1_2]|jgi:hypothetical protein|nr:DUF760 domain-containing protein [Synechococcaceae cyanobacterium RL_1_2]
MVFNPKFFTSKSEQDTGNVLIEYLQKQHPDTLERVAQSASPEIKEIISQNVRGLLGVLPPDGFNVQIMTDRENLANLLASAMMTGYFLRNMEQRMDLEDNLEDFDLDFGVDL